MPFEERDGVVPGDRRADADQFLQELTGRPARSIGWQIAVQPSTPQAANPLASSGMPPSDDSILEYATTQLNVMAGVESPGGQDYSDGEVDIDEANRRFSELADSNEAQLDIDTLPDELASEMPRASVPKRMPLAELEKEEIPEEPPIRLSPKVDQSEPLPPDPEPADEEQSENVPPPEPDTQATVAPPPGTDDSPLTSFMAPLAETLVGLLAPATEAEEPGSKERVNTESQRRDPGLDQPPSLGWPTAQSPTNPQFNAGRRGFDPSLDGLRGDDQSPFSGVGEENRYTSVVDAANAAVDEYDELISMIVAILSRLTAQAEMHSSKLANILDRLDTEADVDEYGEVDSSWLG